MIGRAFLTGRDIGDVTFWRALAGGKNSQITMYSNASHSDQERPNVMKFGMRVGKRVGNEEFEFAFSAPPPLPVAV